METLLSICGTLLGTVVGVAIATWLSEQAVSRQSQEARRRDRLLFLNEALRQLSALYGEARRFLYLEDAGMGRETDKVAEFAQTLGTFSAVALSLNHEKINAIVPRLWMPRVDNAARGELQKALEDIIFHVGESIQQAGEERALIRRA